MEYLVYCRFFFGFRRTEAHPMQSTGIDGAAGHGSTGHVSNFIMFKHLQTALGSKTHGRCYRHRRARALWRTIEQTIDK